MATASEVAGAGGSNGPGSDATTTNVRWHRGRPRRHPGRRRCGRSRQRGPLRQRLGRRRPGHGAEQPRSRRQWRFFGSCRPSSSGGGGGGGYFGGGGGGVSDPAGIFAGAGGGGSGFNDPSTTVLSTSTNTGDGSVTITYPVPVTTTTSGVLRDAATGAPIPNSCVVFSPAAFPGQTNFTNVGGDGTVVIHHGRVRPVQPGLLHHGQRGLQPTDPAHTRALLVHQPAVERDR